MRKIRILSILLATMLAALPLAGCGTQSNDNKGGSTTDKTIAVVAKGESHAFWQSVKKRTRRRSTAIKSPSAVLHPNRQRISPRRWKW